MCQHDQIFAGHLSKGLFYLSLSGRPFWESSSKTVAVISPEFTSQTNESDRCATLAFYGFTYQVSESAESCTNVLQSIQNNPSVLKHGLECGQAADIRRFKHFVAMEQVFRRIGGLAVPCIACLNLFPLPPRSSQPQGVSGIHRGVSGHKYMT